MISKTQGTRTFLNIFNYIINFQNLFPVGWD